MSMHPAPNQAAAALEFASIIAKAGVFAGPMPDPVQALTAFDFDHTLADACSVSVDSSAVDGDSSHPYYANSVGAESSEFPRTAAGLAFVQHVGSIHARPNRCRALNVARQAQGSNLPPVLLDPLRIEFCLDVMLYTYCFVSMLFRDNPAAAPAAKTSPAHAGARNYLQALAYAHALQRVCPVKHLQVLPAGISASFIDQSARELDAVASLSGRWAFSPDASVTDPTPAVLEAIRAADAVGHDELKFEVLAVAAPHQDMGIIPMPMGLIVADIGGSSVSLCTSGHTVRQIASAGILRGAERMVLQQDSDGKVQRITPAAPPANIDPREIPDVFYCHAPIGGPGFFGGAVVPCSFLGSQSVAQALQPVPFAVVDHAMRVAVTARLPWLRVHLPAVAETVEAESRLSVADSRIRDALRADDRSVLHAVLLAAQAAGVNLGTRGLEAAVLGTDLHV